MKVSKDDNGKICPEQDLNAGVIRILLRVPEYNDMKGKLIEYLKQFGEEKKVVKREDIHKFFSNLNDCKRRRLNEDVGPPGFCR